MCGDIADATRALGVAMHLDPERELFGRAAELGRWPQHRVSANQTCRLLATSDSWVALNLARDDDVAALPAIVEDAAGAGVLEAWALAHTAVECAARAQLLGVAAAALGQFTGPAVNTRTLGAAGTVHDAAAHAPPRQRPGVVLDLTALWAGPLVAHVLSGAGYRVVTAESATRPDGMRVGSPGLYARLHSGHELRTLEFRSRSGRAELLELAAGADVVLEASRPRALAELGLVVGQWLAAEPGRTWLSITGYGRQDPAGRIAFGDDAAVAGGLVATDAAGRPAFFGDAVADPLSGLTGAREVCRSQLAGGGHLVDVSMAGVCARIVATRSRDGDDETVTTG